MELIHFLSVSEWISTNHMNEKPIIHIEMLAAVVRVF